MILQTTHMQKDGKPFTVVLCQGVVNDVAAYEAAGHVSGDEAFKVGVKLTHSAALDRGVRWAGHLHYRL